MVVKNGLACGIMLALVGCATKPVSMNKPLLFLKTNYQYRVTRKTRRYGRGDHQA